MLWEIETTSKPTLFQNYYFSKQFLFPLINFYYWFLFYLPTINCLFFKMIKFLESSEPKNRLNKSFEILYLSVPFLFLLLITWLYFYTCALTLFVSFLNYRWTVKPIKSTIQIAKSITSLTNCYNFSFNCQRLLISLILILLFAYNQW